MKITIKEIDDQRIIIEEKNKTRITKRDRVRDIILLKHIQDYIKKHVNKNNRKEFQKLAWYLGEQGEVEACQAIMEYAKEPVFSYSYEEDDYFGNMGSPFPPFFTGP